MNNNVIENNDGNSGTAPAPAAPDKHYEDQATQTEDEDDCGDEDSYCSYNEYSESEQSCLSSPGGKVTNVYYLYQGGCPYPDCPSHTQSHEELSPHNDLADSHNAKEGGGGGRRSRGPPPYSTNSLKLRGKSLGDNVFLDDGDPNLGWNHESS